MRGPGNDPDRGIGNSSIRQRQYSAAAVFGSGSGSGNGNEVGVGRYKCLDENGISA
jgi:hypothetical protein